MSGWPPAVNHRKLRANLAYAGKSGVGPDHMDQPSMGGFAGNHVSVAGSSPQGKVGQQWIGSFSFLCVFMCSLPFSSSGSDITAGVAALSPTLISEHHKHGVVDTFGYDVGVGYTECPTTCIGTGPSVTADLRPADGAASWAGRASTTTDLVPVGGVSAVPEVSAIIQSGRDPEAPTKEQALARRCGCFTTSYHQALRSTRTRIR